MPDRPGWSGLDATEYELNDSRLVGYGNPPSDPAWQRDNPGKGQVQLRQIVIPEATPSLDPAS